MEQPKAPELKLEDVGTRYQHLMDYKETIDSVILIMQEHAVSVTDKQKMAKFMIAAEVFQTHLNALADYYDYTNEYKLYKTIDSIPSDPAQIPGGRGTPLI